MDRRNFLAGIATVPLVLELGAAAPTGVIGKWSGTLRYGDDSAPFALEFKIGGKKHALIAVMWSPAIGIYNMPASYVSLAPGKIALVQAKLDLQYDGKTIRGKLSPLGDTIELHRTTEALPAQPTAAMVVGDPPKRQWEIQTGPIWDAPLVVGSTIYAGDAKGVLRALDAATGAVAWSYTTTSRFFGSPALDGDALLVVDERDTLHRIDVASGTLVWKKSLGSGKKLDTPAPGARFEYRTPTPAVANGVAYLGSGSGTFYALEARTGDVRWKYKTSSPIRATATLAGQRVLFGTWGGDVIALDAAGGKQLWSFKTGKPITMPPVVYNDLAIVGSQNAVLYGLALGTGKRRWQKYYFQSFVESAPVIVDGVAYIGSSDLHAVRAFDPATGRVIWQTTVYGWTWGNPLVRDGVVYVATASLTPYIPGLISGRCALRASDGRTLWRDAVPPTNGIVTGYACDPVFAAGYLIYGAIGGGIAAYR